MKKDCLMSDKLLEKAFILKSLENQEKINEELARLENEAWEEIDKYDLYKEE